MEQSGKDVRPDTRGFCAPILPKTCDQGSAIPGKQVPFSASGKERLLAFFMYVPAFLYLQNGTSWFAVFCVLFVAMTEWFYWSTPRAQESWFWLGCLLVTAYCASFGANRVWGSYTVLFTHAFAVYWVLCRTGRLVEGKSSHLLPLDAFLGLLVFPFKHFFLRTRTVGYTLTHLRSKEKTQPRSVLLFSAAGLALAAALLALAVQNLSDTDAAFHAAAEQLFSVFRLKISITAILHLLMSLPVGAYLFGLIAGTGRENVQSVRTRGEKANRALSSLQKIPTAVWNVVLGIFSALYLAFFGLQASYLFGAFIRTIPDGYTVAEYARQGFFSLCRVMAINFALLWLVTRTGTQSVREKKPCRALCTALILESLLFAAVAASKLYLYIASYGFTPLRLQSAWLIVVLAFGCASTLYTLWTRKNSFRGWMYFSAAALVLLCLY